MKEFIIDNEKLMLDWDWKKNAEHGLDPNVLTCGSNQTAYWKCHVCGHEYTTRIQRKKTGARCKNCIAVDLTTAPREKSVEVLYPEIAKEWDYNNNSTTPDKVYPSSNKKYNWVCDKGHKWSATASHRTTRGDSCPYCSNRKVLKGFNDLETTHGHLMAEWDWDKNNNENIYPWQFSYGSKKVVYWRCSNGHSWACAIYRRTTNKEGCPHCNKELSISFPEKIVAFYLSKIFPDSVENYHCKELKKYEIDIFIPSLNLGIEYDGSQYHKNVQKDIDKDRLCEELDITLFRIREVGCPLYNSNSHKIFVEYRKSDDIKNAVLSILEYINDTFGYAKDIDIDIERDSVEIMSQILSRVKEHSVANSNLISEWDWDKNKNVDPSMISLYSNKKFWWKCSKGHSWKAQVSQRTNGRNCPYCSGQKVLKGFNDLETLFPEIAKEWDYTKNTQKPYEIAAKSNKKYWWICSKCGHSWETVAHVRTGQKCGCPKCKIDKISKLSRKKIVNLDTNEVYDSAKSAATAAGVCPSAISNACRGVSQTAGGYHWKYLDNCQNNINNSK